mmetsp:Transcript_2097/g.6504  ORF Transcript_2097/g.6504 Transcript_2097/m.6504 type:complete len:207 (-) Transcript_2097:118-738(-)
MEGLHNGQADALAASRAGDHGAKADLVRPRHADLARVFQELEGGLEVQGPYEPDEQEGPRPRGVKGEGKRELRPGAAVQDPEEVHGQVGVASLHDDLHQGLQRGLMQVHARDVLAVLLGHRKELVQALLRALAARHPPAARWPTQRRVHRPIGLASVHGARPRLSRLAVAPGGAWPREGATPSPSPSTLPSRHPPRERRVSKEGRG